MRPTRAALVFNWAYLVLVLVLLYAPLVPPLLTAVSPGGHQPGLSGLTLKWYATLGESPVLTGAVRTSLVIAVITALATPLLALAAAMAVRELKAPRLVILAMLTPLFIPGVSMGLADAFFFTQIGIPPSFFTIVVVNVLWALPFAFLIVLTAMSTFDPVYLEAAYVHGAGRLRAFLDVELPLIWPGVLGAATFSVIVSFNETVRTSLVQGPYNTVQTFIWSRYLQVGLTPAVYALMSLMIALTLALVVGLAAANLRRRVTA